MEVKTFEGKNLEELLASSLEELNLTEEDILYTHEETKGGLLKKGSVKLNIYTLTDIQNYIKEYLTEITKLMGLEVTFETKRRENQIYIKMYSDNNSILIGKDGKTLSSLMFIVKQMLSNKYGIHPHILLDVENYKENQERRLERLAKRIARDVVQSKMDVKLDNMNSYERKIIHNVLTNNKKVTTTSEGEEPNRHVVIKYNKEA